MASRRPIASRARLFASGFQVLHFPLQLLRAEEALLLARLRGLRSRFGRLESRRNPMKSPSKRL